jgi:hypothetical protein
MIMDRFGYFKGQRGNSTIHEEDSRKEVSNSASAMSQQSNNNLLDSQKNLV